MAKEMTARLVLFSACAYAHSWETNRRHCATFKKQQQSSFASTVAFVPLPHDKASSRGRCIPALGMLTVDGLSDDNFAAGSDESCQRC